MEQLMIFGLLLAFGVPILRFTLKDDVDYILKGIKRLDEANPYTRKVDKNGNFILKSQPKPKNTKRKVVTTKGYIEVKDLIAKSSKDRLLTRETILEFKALLRFKLGTHYECYRTMRFNNDLHEIYVLLKSNYFTTETYNELNQWLCDHIN